MGKLTKNFSRYEFACKCGCGFDTVDFELLNILQETADFFSNKYSCRIIVIINSGCRCESYNRKVGGHKNSQHMFARAADIAVFKKVNNQKIQIPPQEIYDYLDTKYPNQYGIGHYQTFTHFDTKSGYKRRW